MKSLVLVILLAAFFFVTMAAAVECVAWLPEVHASKAVSVYSSELPEEETASLLELVEVAVAEWQHPYPVRLKFVALDPADYPAGTMAAAGPGWPSGSKPDFDPERNWDCLIGVVPAFWDSNVLRRPLIAHELGHCWGLDHSFGPEPSIMFNSPTVTTQDIARARALWGLLGFRYSLPNLSVE